MKKLLALLSVVLLLVCVGCNSDKNDSSSTKSSAHRNLITGKIIEIKDSDTILLQITEERGEYKKDDKVLIHYREFITEDGRAPDRNQTVSKPSLQDEVDISFWPADVKQKDEYDYIEVLTVCKQLNK